MYITNVINDYDNITDYDNLTLSTCTNSKHNIDIIIPSLIIIPCGLSFLCLLTLMVYTLIEPLINNK